MASSDVINHNFRETFNVHTWPNSRSKGLYACCAAALVASLCALSRSACSLSCFSLWISCFLSASQAGTWPSYRSRSGFSADVSFSWTRAVTNAWKDLGSTLARESSWFRSSLKKKSRENYDLIRNHSNNSRWQLSKHGWKWCKRKETHWKCFERAQGHPLQCITETLEINRKISTASAEASAKDFSSNHLAKISTVHKNTL